MLRKIVFLFLTAFSSVILWAVIYQSWPETSLPANARADKIVVKKSKKEMELFYKKRSLKKYKISIGKNQSGHKIKRGDKRTPEGKYILDWKNAHSKYHLSIHISYPSKNDRKRAKAKGLNPGGDIMIHGLPKYVLFFSKLHRLIGYTYGCIMVTNEEMDEIWRAVAVGTPIEIRP